MTTAVSDRFRLKAICASVSKRAEAKSRNRPSEYLRSVGFAICSSRGIGDPSKDASGISASEGLQYAPGPCVRKNPLRYKRPPPRDDHAHDEHANRNPDHPTDDRAQAAGALRGRKPVGCTLEIAEHRVERRQRP